MSGMTQKCVLCGYEAAVQNFARTRDGKLFCPCCRSHFQNPNVYDEDVAYIACDSDRVIQMYPYDVTQKKVCFNIEEGYMAAVCRSDGTFFYVEHSSGEAISLGGIIVYFICLHPRILWGTDPFEPFGVYGMARLNIDPEYVKDYVGNDTSRLLGLHSHMKALVCNYMSEYVKRIYRSTGAAMLDQPGIYLQAQGAIISAGSGVTVESVVPCGCRKASGEFADFALRDIAKMTGKRSAAPIAETFSEPVKWLEIPGNASYTVEKDCEEVFIRTNRKKERHKAGESISIANNRSIEHIFRFVSKEFAFPYGWGVYNVEGGTERYFSAYGTIEFYIDSTERLCELLAAVDTWKKFITQFFSDAMRPEISESLKTVVNASVTPEKEMKKDLSTMSIETERELNCEDVPNREPSFKKFGLRVKKCNIANISFYTNRR